MSEIFLLYTVNAGVILICCVKWFAPIALRIILTTTFKKM